MCPHCAWVLTMTIPVRLCGGSREEAHAAAVVGMHLQHPPFQDRSNQSGGLSQHYYLQECGLGVAQMASAAHPAPPGPGEGGITGKRGWDQSFSPTCEQQARSKRMLASAAQANAWPANGCVAGQETASGAFFVGDGTQAETETPPAPSDDEPMCPVVSVYEQFLRREEQLMSMMGHRQSLRVPSEWSGTEWDAYGYYPANTPASMECDAETNANGESALFVASQYGDLPPRGC